MIDPLHLCLLAFAVGVGLSMGYYVVQISIALLMSKLQLSKLRKAAKPQSRENPSGGSKLCMKCKKNPRPEGGIHCLDCQFSGGTKFK